MATDKEMLKEIWENYKEVVDVLIGDKLPLIKKYVELEARMNALAKVQEQKPSLFAKEEQPKTDTPFPETVTTSVTSVPKEDPLKQGNTGSKHFDQFPEPEVKRSPTPQLTDLPFDNGVPQEGLKSKLPWDKKTIGKDLNQEENPFPERPKPPKPDDGLPF